MNEVVVTCLNELLWVFLDCISGEKYSDGTVEVKGSVEVFLQDDWSKGRKEMLRFY